MLVVVHDEQTPLDIARHYKLNDITQLLEGKGDKEYSPLMEVAIEEDESPLSTVQKVRKIQTTLMKLSTNIVAILVLI